MSGSDPDEGDGVDAAAQQKCCTRKNPQCMAFDGDSDSALAEAPALTKPDDSGIDVTENEDPVLEKGTPNPHDVGHGCACTAQQSAHDGHGLPPLSKGPVTPGVHKFNTQYNGHAQQPYRKDTNHTCWPTNPCTSTPYGLRGIRRRYRQNPTRGRGQMQHQWSARSLHSEHLPKPYIQITYVDEV